MAIGAIAASTLGQMAFQEADRRRAAKAEGIANEGFNRKMQELEAFKYTNPQAYADQVAAAEKIAGAASQAGDYAIRSGIQQNIEAASRDPRMAPQAASAVEAGGNAAFQNMLREAQYSMPYRQQLADVMGNTQRMNEQFQVGLDQMQLNRQAAAAEAARQEKRIAQQEMGNALLTGISQGIEVRNANMMDNLYRDLYGANKTTGDTASPPVGVSNVTDNSQILRAAQEQMPETIMNSLQTSPAGVDPRSVQVTIPEIPQRDYSSEANLQYGVQDGQVVRTTPGSALQANTSFASPFSVPDMRTRTRFSNFEMPEAPDLSTSIGGLPAPGAGGFNFDDFMQRPLGIQDEISIKTTGRNLRGVPESMPSRSFGTPSEFGGMNNFLDVLGDYQRDSIANIPSGNTIDPLGQGYYNPGMGVADARLDYLSNYGQGSRGVQGLLGMLGSYEEGGGLPIMTPGEPSHETNEQRIIDKQTGAPIADVMGAETVLSDKQTAQIEKDLKEGDEKGLFRFMKKLFNKPQFKKQRAQNGDYKGRKDMPQAPQAPGPGGQADPRMAIMQAMMGR